MWSLSVLIDVTIESLCLDDNDDREIEENETTSNLTENEFELLSAWWEICSNVTNMFLHIMNSFEKSLTMDLIIQFLYLWESFPQILSPIEKCKNGISIFPYDSL